MTHHPLSHFHLGVVTILRNAKHSLVLSSPHYKGGEMTGKQMDVSSLVKKMTIEPFMCRTRTPCPVLCLLLHAVVGTNQSAPVCRRLRFSFLQPRVVLKKNKKHSPQSNVAIFNKLQSSIATRARNV